MKTLPCILMLCGFLSLVSAQDSRPGIIEGRLINKTDPSVGVVGARLEVIALADGMSIIQTAQADANGRFRIEGLPASQQLMMRASYKGANYHSMLSFNSEGKAGVEMDVYEPALSMKDIRIESMQLAFQMSGDRLQAVETYAIINETRPPRVYVNREGSFRISKAPGILEPPQVRVTAPGSEMPLVQAALESADGASYYSLYPLRPGKTVFEVQQLFPYADRKFSYNKRFYLDCSRVSVGVIPHDMVLSGKGLTKTEVDAGRNFAVYASAPVEAGAEATWTFSGGTPVLQTEQSSENTEDMIKALPGIIGRRALVIGPLLLMGFVLALWCAYNRNV